MEIIKKHKTLFIVCTVCVVLLILMIAAIYSMFNPKKLSGDNLVDIPKDMLETVKREVNSSEFVNDVKYDENSGVINFIINVNDDTKVEDSCSLGDTVLENISSEVLSYYDVQIYMTSSVEDHIIVGYHSTGADAFTWTINWGEVSE